ncbi:MAG: hypothetical protein PVG97_07015, partial [Syntrophobacterales bacterium]
MTSKSPKSSPTVRWIRFRLLLITGGLLCAFLFLIARSFQIQFFQRQDWADFAKKQIQRNLRLEPRRGDIYDRNGQELAVSIEMESLAANPRIIENPKATARQLSRLIQIPAASLAKKLRQKRAFVWLRHYLSPRQADAVRALGIKGIHFVK